MSRPDPVLADTFGDDLAFADRVGDSVCTSDADSVTLTEQSTVDLT